MADDYNIRAAKGQAFNLAVHRAISEGKGDDTKYIFSLYLKYYDLGQLVQNSTLDELRAVLT